VRHTLTSYTNVKTTTPKPKPGTKTTSKPS
jgi:hypothetical protein